MADPFEDLQLNYYDNLFDINDPLANLFNYNPARGLEVLLRQTPRSRQNFLFTRAFMDRLGSNDALQTLASIFMPPVPEERGGSGNIAPFAAEMVANLFGDSLGNQLKPGQQWTGQQLPVDLRKILSNANAVGETILGVLTGNSNLPGSQGLMAATLQAGAGPDTPGSQMMTAEEVAGNLKNIIQTVGAFSMNQLHQSLVINQLDRMVTDYYSSGAYNSMNFVDYLLQESGKWLLKWFRLDPSLLKRQSGPEQQANTSAGDQMASAAAGAPTSQPMATVPGYDLRGNYIGGQGSAGFGGLR